MLYREIVKKNNPIVYQIIKNAIEKNKVSHAFLFSGPKNLKIENQPLFLIQSLISERPFSNEILRSINSYADLTIIDGSKNLIKKEYVLQAIDKMQSTPIETMGKKILFIKNIENANKYSLNSLLKLIEEPRPNTYIVVTTNNISQVLSTIKSRSQVISLRSIPVNQMIQNIEELGIKKKWAKLLANIVYSLNEAQEVFDDSFKEIYENVITTLDKSIRNKNFFYSNLNSLINKKNYRVYLNLLKIFFSDVWKLQEKLDLNFENENLIKKYQVSKFDFQKAQVEINDFMIMQNYHVNFDLYKSKLLIKIGECYE